MTYTLIMAPLQGFTDRTFRQVFARHFHGIDSAVAPFISTMSQKKLKSNRLKDVQIEKDSCFPVIPQILGNNAQDFIFLANHLFDMGHEKLNWNLGCPHPKVAKKMRGSGLLSYPAVVDSLLEKIVPHLSGTLSIKLRLGRNDPEEIFNLLPVLDKYPLDDITVHPRTGIQMYEGTVDHDTFGQVLLHTRHSITYNGDITDSLTFRTFSEKFPGIREIMIGRGLLSNPFLAEDIKGVMGRGNRKQRIVAFHDDLLEGYRLIFNGPGHLTGRMKGFWTFLGPSFNNSGKALKKILKASSIEAYQNSVSDFFQQDLDFKENS